MLATTLHLQLTIAPSARPCANMNKTVTRKNTGPIENQRQLSIGSDLLALEVVGTSLPPPTAVVSYQSLPTAVAKMHATFGSPIQKLLAMQQYAPVQSIRTVCVWHMPKSCVVVHLVCSGC